MKTRIEQFKGLYQNKPAVVCGTGPSVSDFLPYCKDRGLVTIGVNSIGQHWFHPEHLVIIDRFYQPESDAVYPEDQKSKIAAMVANQSLYTFYPYEGIFLFSQFIKFRMCGGRPLDYAHTHDQLWYYYTTTITGISLAVYMGCPQIGVIGLDCSKNHPTYGVLAGIEQTLKSILNYTRSCGIEIVNLSPISLVEALPKMDLARFIELYTRGNIDAS